MRSMQNDSISLGVAEVNPLPVKPCWQFSVYASYIMQNTVSVKHLLKKGSVLLDFYNFKT